MAGAMCGGQIKTSRWSEDCVDEWRQGRTLRKHQQRPYENEDKEDRQQPELFALAEEKPQLAAETRLRHKHSTNVAEADNHRMGGDRAPKLTAGR